MEQNKTPEEVYRILQKEFKSRKISLEDVAKKLGYKTKQTIYNLGVSGRYMRPETAQRFVDAFGFDYKFLTTGEGFIYPPIESNIGVLADMKFEYLKMVAYFVIADSFLRRPGGPNVNKAWEAIYHERAEEFMALVRPFVNTSTRLDEEDFELLSTIICAQSMKDLVEHLGYYLDGEMLRVHFSV